MHKSTNAPSEKPASADKSEFCAHCLNFSQSIVAIRLFTEEIGPVADERDEGAARANAKGLFEAMGLTVPSSLMTYLDTGVLTVEQCKEEENRDTSANLSLPSRFNVSPERLAHITRYMAKVRRRACDHGGVLRRSTLITVVTLLDALIAGLLKRFYKRHPGALSAEQQPLTFKDLCDLGSLEVAREAVLSRKVDGILHLSLRDQFEFFRKTLKVDLSYIDKYFHILDETIQRRHLWVHNGGLVSKLYLNRVDPTLVAKYCAKENAILDVSHEYLKRAIDRINLAGVVLGQQCWRKWVPAESLQADQILNDNMFDAILGGRFIAAQYLGEYAIQVCKSNESTRRNVILNLAQAYKWAGKGKKARETVEGEDWTSSALKFQLAAAVICDEFDKAVSLLPRAIKADDLHLADFREWPIFQQFRKDPRTQAIIAEHDRTMTPCVESIQGPQQITS